MDNLLLQIVLEAAHRASVIPFASEATIYAMKSFGTRDMLLPVALAVAGGMIGHGFNFWLGRMMMKLPSNPKNKPLFQLLEKHAAKWGFIALVLAPLALGNLLVVAAGMLAVPLKKALPAILLGLAAYYGQLLA